MENETDIFELRFVGGGINPYIVKPFEVAQVIEQFEKAVLSIVKQQSPSIDTKTVLIAFENIRNESLGLQFLTPNNIAKEIRDVIVGSYLLLNISIKNNEYNKLPNETITQLQGIKKFTKKYNCTADFNYNGNNLSSITPTVDIQQNQPAYLKGDITIYGQLIDVGGENPNIHIKLGDDYIIIVDTKKAVAKDLGSRLFDTIGLKGNAKWDIVTSKIIEFTLHQVVEFSSGKISKSIAELRNASNGGWDDFNTNEEINNQLLRN